MKRRANRLFNRGYIGMLVLATAIIVSMGFYPSEPVVQAAILTPPCTEMAIQNALTAAGASAEADTIELDPGCICTLTSPLVVTGSLTEGATTINGRGATINGNNLTKLFEVQSGAKLVLNQITLTGGNSGGNGGAMTIAGLADVTINNSTINGNHAALDGGAFYKQGNLYLNNSTISGNTAAGNGGGIAVAGGQTQMSFTTLVKNIANQNNDSTGAGGGLYRGTSGSITVHNSVVVGNDLGNGTRNDCEGTTNFMSTPGFNIVGAGCGISGGSGTFLIEGDISGVVNPSLANNGGPTKTHALASGSRARNAASSCNFLDGSLATTDQRGFTRPGDFDCDLGAFEFNASAIYVVNSAGDSGTGGCTTDECTLREAVEAANADHSPSRIDFNIPGPGPHEIKLTANLPSLTERTTIDGLSQPANGGSAASCTAGPLLINITRPSGTDGDGLQLSGAGSSNSTIRGLAISGFNANSSNAGIELLNSNGNTIQCNFLGTNAAGTAAANGGNSIGVHLTQSLGNLIGTNGDNLNDANERNLASGNRFFGIYFDGASFGKAAGNYLGTDITGVNSIPNESGVGVANNTTSLVIGFDGTGGTPAVEGNLVRFNTGAGVVVLTPSSKGIRISANRIDSQSNLGIDLSATNSADGVSGNDLGDDDGGPNNRQNFPVINSAATDGTETTVNYSLASHAGNYTVEFYSNPACDASGNGEGQVYLGSANITLPGGPFNAILPHVTAGHVITATAINLTDTDNSDIGDTSEFSACRTVNTAPTVTQLMQVAQQGSAPQSFTIGNASDNEDAEQILQMEISSDGTTFGNSATAFGVAVTLTDSNLNASGSNPNAMGQVTGSITASCAALNAAFTLRVTDSGGLTATTTLNINVSANTPPALGYGTQTVAATTTPMFDPSTGPSDNGAVASIILQSITPMTGLSLSVNNKTGRVTVTGATIPRAYTVVIRASDNCAPGANTFTDVTFTVNVECPTITLSSLANGVAGTPYNQTVTALPAGGSYTFMRSGTLPPGLTFNTATGQLSGTPATAGTYSFTITATGFGTCSQSRTYELTIACPTISLSALPNGMVESPYNHTVTASPAGGNYSFAKTDGTLPPGLQFEMTTGQLSGTPTAAGSFSFTITATGFGLCAQSRVYTIVIACPTISLSPSTLPNALLFSPYTQKLTAAPAGAYTFALTNGSLPPGLKLSSDGMLSGSPTQNGTFSFRVTATGQGTCTGSRQYTLIVACPTITLDPLSLPGGTLGDLYAASVTASPAGSYQYTVQGGVLPGGLTFNSSTGEIGGTPTESGTFNFIIRATAGACSGSRSYTITIACPTITFTPTSLTAGELGIFYERSLSITPSGGYVFLLLSGNLPSGLTLNATSGEISGTPTVAGTFTITIKAQRAGGCSGTQQYTLVINCPTITVNPETLPAGRRGTAYSQIFSATPAGGTYSYAVTNGVLPNGLNLNAMTGVLSGVPTVNGGYTFTIRATRVGSSCTGSRSYTVVVNNTGITAAIVSDYDGDGRSDFITWSEEEKDWLIVGSSDEQIQKVNWEGRYDPADDVLASGDYDGDGMYDFALYRGSTGEWLIKRSRDGVIVTEQWSEGTSVPADYDGDGRTDIAVWQRATGKWAIKRSSDGREEIAYWGSDQDLPVVGDYDGDGKADLAIYRALNHRWQIKQSSDGLVIDREFGVKGDLPLAADYDGDGKSDIAIWRASEGGWHHLSSVDGGEREEAMGQGAPISGDYDGDGRSEIAVWQGSERAWRVRPGGARLKVIIPERKPRQ